MEMQSAKISSNIAKPIKVVIAVIVVVLTLFVLGFIKNIPVYEIRKEVAL